MGGLQVWVQEGSLALTQPLGGVQKGSLALTKAVRGLNIGVYLGVYLGVHLGFKDVEVLVQVLEPQTHIEEDLVIHV